MSLTGNFTLGFLRSFVLDDTVLHRVKRVCASVLELGNTAMPKDRIREEKHRVLRKHHSVTYTKLFHSWFGFIVQKWIALKTPQLVATLVAAWSPAVALWHFLSLTETQPHPWSLAGVDHFRVQNRPECGLENPSVSG